MKDFVRVLEAFQVIMDGIEQIKKQAEEHSEMTVGLLAKLLNGFEPLKGLMEGWEHAFDWEKAKEDGTKALRCH